MITLQLAPSNELEEKDWWHVDLLVFVVVAFLAYMGVHRGFDMKRAATAIAIARAAQLNSERELLLPSVSKIATLNSDNGLLNGRISAIKSIMDSRAQKMQAIVALDQLQTLWMEGIWYTDLSYSTDGNVAIKGRGFDSLLIGDYLLGVRESMNPGTRNDDLRTQSGFDKLVLTSVKQVESDPNFPDIVKSLEFDLTGVHIAKAVGQVGEVSAALRPFEKQEF